MTAKRIALMLATILLLIPLAVSLAPAGEIYGKVLEGAAPVAEGTALEVKCGAKSYPVKTDKTGSYRVVTAETGKCTMTVTYKQQSASLEIPSYEDPSQVDLVLETKDGKLSARRK